MGAWVIRLGWKGMRGKGLGYVRFIYKLFLCDALLKKKSPAFIASCGILDLAASLFSCVLKTYINIDIIIPSFCTSFLTPLLLSKINAYSSQCRQTANALALQRNISYLLPLLSLPFSPALLLGLSSSTGTARNPPNPFPTTTLFLTFPLSSFQPRKFKLSSP
jgi:hypothetical protein